MPSLIPTPERVAHGAANAFDMVFKGGLADRRPTPARVISEAPKGTILQYLPAEAERQRQLPVLLVPPLAAPATCFDLRRGCSMAEHLLALGHPTYQLDYGPIAFADRDLGLEHWVREIIPRAIAEVSEHADGRPVQLVGWSLGGIMALLSVAAVPELPVSAVATVGSPFDFNELRLFAPFRRAANLTNGAVGSLIYRTFGGAPAPLVKRAFQLTSLDKQLAKPVFLLANLHDRDVLAHMEAVEGFTSTMHAYPGRSVGQLYHQVFRDNDLVDGRLTLGEQQIDLADVRVPVAAIAGTGDALAPPRAVHHVARLLTSAPEVLLETAPGGHLGVLAGRSAASTTWRIIDEFFARHEQPDAEAAAPERARAA